MIVNPHAGVCARSREQSVLDALDDLGNMLEISAIALLLSIGVLVRLSRRRGAGHAVSIVSAWCLFTAVVGYWAYAYLAVCHWRMGDGEKAAVAVRECLVARPDVTVDFILSGDPYRDLEFVGTVRKDLIAVGIPSK